MLIYIIKRGALTNNSLLKAILSDWEPNIVMVYFSFRRPAVVYIGSIGNKSVLTLLQRDIQCNGDLSVSFFFPLLDYDGHTSVIDAACPTSFTPY